MKKLIIAICLIGTLYSGCIAYDGQLDSSFNGNGMVVTAINNIASIRSVAIQIDGKIVVAGSSGTNNFMTNFTLARYNTNGTLDNSFGVMGTGIVITPLSGTLNVINALVIQTDGKIVVAGQGTVSNTFVIARYNLDGILDTTFGNIGIVSTNFSTPSSIKSLALQQDGKIVVVGQPTTGSTEFIVARYYINGVLDNGSQGGSGFGRNGIVTIHLSGADEATSIAVQGDGKIVIGGSAQSVGVRTFAVARLEINGTLDLTFGGTGSILTSFEQDAQAQTLVIQPDGNIILGGSTGSFGNHQFALARYLSDGTLDTEFGVNGKVTTAIGTDDQIFQFVLQSDGKLIATGLSTLSGVENFAVARYNLNGLLDATFNPSANMPGVVITSFNAGLASEAFGSAIQSNGRIVVIGTTFNVNGMFALARYLNNTPLVSTQITAPINGMLFSNGAFTISGVAQNPSNIGIFSDDILIGSTVTAGATNTWTVQTTVMLDNGPHVITAVAEYKDGNVNVSSANSVAISINTCRSILSAAIAAKYCSRTMA